ncbi:hypothetical protein BIY21_03315 [Vibrio ponticus]|uniref:IS1 family transposase n=1 Tax=Vibrio ponticus TaxID=265668 RepID=A0ABX3FDU6_9VIBR|nr:hypothetical protein [Vibrio ponticus]OLQ87530.1 hypothetical protein BIY21_03315 [Vibrio ponticus]
MSFRQNYNGCKTFGCRNCGNPDQNLYQFSERLGYLAWHCNLCGAFPPVLLNEPILTLAAQLQQYQFHHYPNKNCDCKPASWLRYGHTPTGSQRIQCQHCMQVHTLTNPNQQAKRLQPWLDALLSGITPDKLQSQLGLTNKVFSQHLQQLCQLLNQYSRWIEQKELTLTTTLNWYSFTYRQRCRSGLSSNAKQHAAHLWTLCTLDSHSGYVYLISDNALINNQGHANPAANWQADAQYQAKTKESSLSHEPDVLNRAEQTYQKILARSQFDQIAYCEPQHGQLRLEKSTHNALLRPVYAAHAHMQNLYQHLPSHVALNWLLEHESFIRGAAITSFSARVKAGDTALYYYHHTLNSQQTESINQQRTLSWWNEKWHKLFVSDKQTTHQVGIGVLTSHTDKTQEQLTPLLPRHLNVAEQFCQQFTLWLPDSYASKLSVTRVQQWQTIYRYLHNYLLVDSPRINSSLAASAHSISAIVEQLNNAAIENSNRG